MPRITVIFSLLFVIILIIISIPDSTLKDPPEHHVSHVYYTLYIDRTFSDDEKLFIVEAALQWMRQTNYFVIFNIAELPNNSFGNIGDVIISPISEDSPYLLPIDLFNGWSTLGYYTPNTILPSVSLVTARIPPEHYRLVVLHELGHVLGLMHARGWEGINTLMYPGLSLSSNDITYSDVIELCKLYGCNPDNVFHR